MSERVTIGGSDAAAACGLDPFRSRVALWLEKTGRVEPRDESEAVLWGTLLEPVIAQEVESRGYAVAPAPADPYLDGFMHGHLDGFVAPGELTSVESPTSTGRGVLEVKTTSAYRSRDWHDDAVPPAYVIQVHHYMHLSGLTWALVACLIGGQRLELRPVERDERLTELILQLEEEFVSLVTSDTPPAPDGSESAAEMIRLLYPEAQEGKIVQATSADAELCAEIRKLKRAAKATEQQLAEREQALKARMGDAEVLWYEGRKLASWPTVSGMRQPQPGGPFSYRRLTVSQPPLPDLAHSKPKTPNGEGE